MPDLLSARLPARRLLIVLALLGVLSAHVRAEEPGGLPVIPREGESFSASGILLDDAGRVTFTTPDGAREFPLAELIAWGAAAEPKADAQVLLSDGSLLVGEVLSLDGTSLTLFTDLLDEVSIATDLVRGILFQPPESPHARDLLAEQARDDQARGDRLVLVNGDQLTGTLLGTKPDADRPTLRLRTELNEVEIEQQRVAAVLFNPALVKAAPRRETTTLVGLADGTLLMTRSVTVSAEEMQAQLVSGPRVVSDRPGRIVLLQPLSGKWTYLSEMPARSYKHVPYLTVSWPYHNDRNAAGSRLRSDGRIYAKGLGMHSASRLMYLIEKPHRRFEAELALDELAGDQGSVIYRVYLNKGSGWQPAFASETIRGGNAPTPVSVDVEGAKAILLMVDYADRGDQLDYANWLNARLVE